MMLPALERLRCRLWAISLAAGLALLATTLMVWRRKFATRKTPPRLRVAILSKGRLLELLGCIRKQYSAEYLQLRRTARKLRRLHPRGSDEYRREVVEYHKAVRELLRRVSESVIRTRGFADTLVVSSFSFYEEDEEVLEAQSNLGVPVSDIRVPPLLTVDVVKDIYTYCHERATLTTRESFEDYAVKSMELEDELWERFGFEAEEIEKAYFHFRHELSKLETQFKLQGCFSFNSSMDEEDLPQTDE